MAALSIVRRYFPKVEKVVDASENIKIEVTKRDTNSAQVRNHNACAMAVACKRKFGLDGVIVSSTKAYLVKGNQATRYCLPESVSREIVSFDRNGGFDEGDYQLKRPSPMKKLGHHQGGNGKRNGKGKSINFRHYTGGIRTALGGKKNPDGIVRAHA